MLGAPSRDPVCQRAGSSGQPASSGRSPPVRASKAVHDPRGASVTRLLRPARQRGTRIAAATIGAAVALAATALVGVALAKTFTLNVAKHAKVTNQSLKTT